LLAHYLKPDEQIVRFLLGQDGLDPRLAEFCEILAPAVSFEDLTLKDELKEALPAVVIQAREERYPLRFYFQGPHGVDKRQAAEALAYEAGALLLTVDLARTLDTNAGFDQILRLIFREAWFQNAILFLDNMDLFFSRDRTHQHSRLLEVLTTDRGITILAGAKPWLPAARVPTGTITVRFDIPNFKQRRICWQAKLKEAGFTLNGRKLDVLAGRFRLTPGQVAEAVTVASNHARWRTGCESTRNSSQRSNGQPTIDDFLIAARAQSGHDLETLVRKIEPIHAWDDIVLPEETITQLQEICQWIKHRHRVLGEWGFDRKLSLGKGVNALFAGPSGTGKTMTAEIIANELGLDLYKIDLAGIVSKYIGETERNLDRIFGAAEDSNAILFFDEADALFGKRSEVRDSHDRYANIEISYLLQKMEEFGGKNGAGIAILCTNLHQNLDESFVRRLAFTVHFAFPDEASRRAIWKKIWPPETPLTDDLDLDFVAGQFKLSGGNIKNIALAAAFLAAEDGGHVAMTHVLRATQREYQKMGKIMTKEDLNPCHQEILL
jgi:SpoVK/Ycf46/Vps4 family AAA+-type ATPase